MDHDYTDEEIIRIIRARKRKKRRQRILRRRISLILLLFLLLLCIFGVHSLLSHSGSSTAKKNSSGSAAVKHRGTVFIDPGHGGNDPGAEALGRTEKEDTLKLSLAVAKQLKKLGLTAEMSRTDDTAVDRPHRGEIANEKGAKLFVSIHRNKATSGQGVEIWIPSDDPKDSRLLAENIMKKLEKAGITANRGVRTGTLPDRTDDYQENLTPDMPSCLIEFGFISDREDNKLFDAKQNAYAKAMAEAISNTYHTLYEKS